MATIETRQARQTVFVDTFTDGLLGPDVPMLGPVADGGHIVVAIAIRIRDTCDVSGTVTLEVEVIKDLGIDGPVLFPVAEDLPFRAPVDRLEARGLLSYARELYAG